MKGMLTRAIFVSFVHSGFVSYTILLFLRILSSWFPAEWQGHRFVRFLAFYTDPYLNIFRRFIPPIGGMLDLSPIVAFLALKFLEMFVLGIIR
jgi:YggT family protein